MPARDVQRIAVFRALMLGDMLVAVPALRALRAGYPDAQITLIGLPWARSLAERLACIDDFIEFPGFPGLPETAPRVAELPAFLQHAVERRFDLIVQLHGSGDLTNPIVAACGARHTAGFHVRGAWCPEPPLYTEWPSHGNEIDRLLHAIDTLGLERRGTDLEFPLRAADRDSLAALWPGGQSPARPVCVHAGAQLASRRWPVERFARVADALTYAGYTVVLTGVASEAALARTLQARMTTRPIDLVGQTTLWQLGALIEASRLLVCNDTSVSHIAAALGTPSVVVSCGADVARWAPLDRRRHRVLWRDVPCRPCSFAVCPTRHECATALGAHEVIDAALRQVAPEAADA